MCLQYKKNDLVFSLVPYYFTLFILSGGKADQVYRSCAKHIQGVVTRSVLNLNSLGLIRDIMTIL